jgi:DNA-directed RNA polymerase specialized sigma54-like protein
MKRIGGVVVRKLDKTGVTANNVISCIFLHLHRVYKKANASLVSYCRL